LRGGVPLQWSWPVKENKGVVVTKGRSFGYGEGGMVRE